MPFVSLVSSEKFEHHIRTRLRQWFIEGGENERAVAAAVDWTPETLFAFFHGEGVIDHQRAVAMTEHFGHTVPELLAR